MRHGIIGAALIGIGMLALAGDAVSAASDNKVIYMTAKELQDKVAKTENNVATYFLETGPDAIVIDAHRDGVGDVEIHTKKHDVIVIQSGTGTITIGGTAQGQKETAPNEFRGGQITGGKTYTLVPGDTIWIPASVPHQMIVEKGKNLNYLAIKFDAK